MRLALLVDRGDRPPDHRRVADLPDLLVPGDLLVLNETRVIPARLRLRPHDRRERPRCCCSSRATSIVARWEALVRPGEKLRGRRGALDRRRRAAGRGWGSAPQRATRSWSTCSVTTIRWRCSTGTARCHCRPTSATRLDDPERYQTVLRQRAGFGGRADGRTALHVGAVRPARCAAACAGRRSNSSSGSTRSSRSAPTIRSTTRCTPSATGSPTRRCGRVSTRERPEVGSSQSGPRRSGRSSRRRHAASSPAAPTCSSIAGSTGRSSTC